MIVLTESEKKYAAVGVSALRNAMLMNNTGTTAALIAGIRYALSYTTDIQARIAHTIALAKWCTLHPADADVYIVQRKRDFLAAAAPVVRQLANDYASRYGQRGPGFWPNSRFEYVINPIAVVSDRDVIAVHRAELTALLVAYKQQAAKVQTRAADADLSVRSMLANEAIVSTADRKRISQDQRGKCYICGAAKPREVQCTICGYRPMKGGA